jgi:dipicolinate synthase subunit A
MNNMDQKSLAILGGDDRELILIRELIKKGYYIQVFGFPAHLLPRGTAVYSTIAEATSKVDTIILPMPGINQNGLLHTKYTETKVTVSMQDFAQIPEGTRVFVGKASQYLTQLANMVGFKIIEVGNLDEIAIPNSIPTAEGAIQLAMEKLPITIHSSQTFIIGFGRVAETLAWMLKGLGAHITVVARNPVQLAKCRVLGYRAEELINLKMIVGEANLLFNTVPAMVIKKDILAHMNRETIIIDLASSPGGTEFQAAKELGIYASLALGLPGKVAPVTAGRILSEVYPVLIHDIVPKSTSC